MTHYLEVMLVVPPRVIKQQVTFCCQKMHYCVIIKGGKVISTGFNKPTSFRHNGVHYMRHAECDAILNLPRKYHLKGLKIDLNVIRYGLAESKPCCHCIQYMRSVNVRIDNIYYSTGGNTSSVKLEAIENSHISSYWQAQNARARDHEK